MNGSVLLVVCNYSTFERRRRPNAPLWLTLAPTAFCQSHLWVDCWNIWPTGTVFSSTLSANGTLLSLWQKALKNILFLKCISFDWFCYVLICCVWGVISEGSALAKVSEYWLVEINIGIVIPFLFVFLQTYNLGSSNNEMHSFHNVFNPSPAHLFKIYDRIAMRIYSWLQH